MIYPTDVKSIKDTIVAMPNIFFNFQSHIASVIIERKPSNLGNEEYEQQPQTFIPIKNTVALSHVINDPGKDSSHRLTLVGAIGW